MAPQLASILQKMAGGIVMTELTRLLWDYRMERLSWDAFYRRALVQMEVVLTRSLKIDRESQTDIIGEFYPRFLRICHDYNDSGSSFDAYLFTSLRYFVRTWQRKQARRTRTENTLGCHDPDELSVSEEPPAIELPPCSEDGLAILSNNRQRDTVRRQLLICLCKNLPLLDHDEIHYYAALFGLPVNWIYSFESYLHERRVRISRARTEYREYRDRHYAAMMHHQFFPENARSNGYDPVEFHRRRWRYYRRRLERQTVHLTNREVALILGIPKGSVDSALSNLSQRLAQRRRTRIGSPHAHEDTSGIEQLP